MFLTMVFFATGVCENGCTIEKAGVFSILGGFMWLFAAGFAIKSTPRDPSLPKSSCCCCPLPVSPAGDTYKAIPIRDQEQEVSQENEAQKSDSGKSSADPQEKALE